MKNSLLFTVLVCAAFLVSCGSQQNFSSRKYTKGKFRVAHKRLKSAPPETHHDGKLTSDDFQQEIRKQEVSLIHVKPQEESKESIAEVVFVDEAYASVPEGKDEVSVESNSIATSNAQKHQRKPRSQLVELKEKKRGKKDLNTAQRNARSSLIWGIVAISLAAIFLTLSIVAMPAFPAPFFFIYVARSIRIAMIPAFIGAILGTFAKFGKEDLGKYEKHQRVGFWLSVSTILLWVLLV